MSKQNFENLQFDVTKFGGRVSIQDAYPELLPYKEYEHITSEEWKVAILMTDVGSSFVKIKDQSQKIQNIFDELKIDRKKNEKLYDEAVNQKQSSVVDACSFLIEYQNNHEFAAWFQLNKIYYELLQVISKPLDINSQNYDKEFDRRMILQAKLSTMQADLKKYETSLFGTAAMKAAAAFRSKKKMHINYNEKYAQENQVE